LAMGQVFSEYFGFPFQLSFHRLLHTHHHLYSGAATIGQLVADVISGESHPTKLLSVQEDFRYGNFVAHTYVAYGSAVVALCYKLEGQGFESFQPHYDPELETQPLTEMSTRNP
jgi:hypothetical protein